MKRVNFMLFVLSIFVLGSCTISPTAKQYAVESDFFNGKMTIHEGPGVKDYFNILDRTTYYDKVSGYSFSSAEDEGNSPISIRFSNNGIAYLSGHTDYRLPDGEQKHLMADIEENYESPTRVEQRLIRQALEKSAFSSGQFMNVFDALSKNRSFLQEIIFDQANNGQYKVAYDEEKVIDIATGKEQVEKISTRIPCTDGPNCIAGYERTEVSALRLYGIQLFNFTVKELRGEASIESAIEANLKRSNRMEELAIQSREAQVKSATVVEESKADVAIKEAETAIAVAEARKQTAIAQEELIQKKFQADAEYYAREREAASTKLKVAAGLTPLKAAEIERDTKIGIAKAYAGPNGLVLPSTFIGGTDSKGNPVDPFTAVGLESLMRITGTDQ